MCNGSCSPAEGPTRAENAPTCYRAPRWPDPESPRKMPKEYPWPEILDSQRLPPKQQKKPKMPILGFFFSGILGVFSWGSRISAWGVFFRHFSWKFRVGPCRGSVAGRGVLNTRVAGSASHRLLNSLSKSVRRLLSENDNRCSFCSTTLQKLQCDFCFLHVACCRDGV